ncbi:glycosyltransferase [Psychrobacter sp. 72-O-c]|uniref:glycosyltransferase n=1 Tax=Psychrobacter sp. 72-O-c TaxID=2774125 RepID=UPI001D0F9D26|nr:glycosyltransferase [Psychrobacter sp. 72-O-c]
MNIQRVLHIIGHMNRAGAETMLMNLYRHTDRTQIQFDFITFTGEPGDYDAEIIELGGKIIPVLADNPIGRMLKLQQFLEQHPEYKIVHAHMLLSNAFHLLAAKRAGVKNRISHSHCASNGHSSSIKKIYEKWAFIVNRKLATYKISCGELAAEYLFGTTKDVLLLPNAVDIEEMIEVANKSRNYISQVFNESDLSLKILQVGRLNEAKNHRFTLEIAQELKACNVDFTIYIVGQGQLEEGLKQQVKDKSLQNEVKFLGVRSDVAELMASADYMIMPSLYEGFPVVLVESQTVGLASIISNQISAEVDLGLDLVEFLPLDSAKPWAKRLLGSKGVCVSNDVIKDRLQLQGFDVAVNAEKLTRLYKSL